MRAQCACIELSKLLLFWGTTTISWHINFSVFGNLSLHRRSHTAHTRQNRCERRIAKRIHAQELCVVHTRHTYDMCLPQKPFEMANSNIFINFAWARCHRCRVYAARALWCTPQMVKSFLRNNFPFVGLEWRWSALARRKCQTASPLLIGMELHIHTVRICVPRVLPFPVATHPRS